MAEFCAAPSGATAPVVMAGRRLQWARPLAGGLSANDVAGIALADPRRFVAVSTRWLAVHDGSKGILTRADCETGDVRNFEQSRPVTALAISQFGDIAEQVEGGATIVYPRQVTGYSGSEAPRIERAAEGSGARVLVWSGRRLLIVGRAEIVTLDVAAQSVARPVPAVSAQLAADPDAVFVLNGLTYIPNGLCVDVFVGAALSPHLRRAACMRQPLSDATVLLAGPTNLEVLNSKGASIETLPRPSVAHAKLAGTTWDISAGVLSLLEHPVVPTVPLVGTDVGGTPTGVPYVQPASPKGVPNVQPANASPDVWSKLLPRNYWNVDRGYDRMLRAVQAKGWTDLREEGTWSSGNGVAAVWRRGTSLVAPRGRTLQALAQLTDQKEFTDTQIRRIIEDNSALADTIEGVFIEAGWIPVGALFGGDTTLPPAFATPEALASLIKGSERPGAVIVREALQPRDICRSITNVAPDAALSANFRRGLSAAGAVDGGGEAPLVRADEVLIFDCGSKTPVQVALLSGLKATFQVEKTSRSVSRVIAAVRGLPADAVTSLTRSWLDRILRMRGRLPSLLLPTTSLELEFVINARTPLAELQRPGIQLSSAEAVPAMARVGTPEGVPYVRTRVGIPEGMPSGRKAPSPLPQPDPCSAVEEALKARVGHEAAMSLGSVDFMSRRLTPPVKIGVAENAVPLLSPLFNRNGQPIWWEPKDTGEFGPIAQPLAKDPSVRAARDLRHGSQVAGMLVVAKNGALRGVLSDAALVWIDTEEAPKDLRPLFDQLFARKTIVNVSARLAPRWSSLSTDNSSWTSRVLFVAAAKNIDEDIDGPPLTWVERTNVIGVGLIDASGALLPQSNYDRDVVDLVAPGAAVPTVDEAEALRCDAGTSFATAYVTAITAILAERAPRSWTPSQLRSRLLSTADWKPEYAGKVKGGMVNADRALKDLDKNILLIDRGSQPPLALDVDWRESGDFNVTGIEKPGGARATHRVHWFDILRWQVIDDGSGGKSIRVAFIRGDKYVVLDNVSVQPGLILPIRLCRNQATGNEVGCANTRAEQVRDYTSALYAGAGPVKF